MTGTDAAPGWLLGGLVVAGAIVVAMFASAALAAFVYWGRP